MIKASTFLKLFLLFFALFFFSGQNVFAKKFTVVIDAGHGGNDSGARGTFSKEKDLNLDVSLLLGKMIEKNNPDVNVVYTRKTDVFLPLQTRADIVNKNNADIFFCIHTNANNNKSARGTETYTLRASGSRTEGNLEVAMRENSVMTLEENYKTTYQGFDPRSIDSYIMFDFMQDKYLDKSIKLASSIQKQFTSIGRYNRGVQQAGFWVLYKSACPSVLVEMGFISNPTEEKYLNSESGQKEIATALYNAFLSYKKEYDDKNNMSSAITSAPKNNTLNDSTTDKKDDNTTHNEDASAKRNPPSNSISSSPVYKVQLLAVSKKLSSNSKQFKGLSNVSYFYENGMYKYTYGECATLKEANDVKKKIKNKFPNAFVVELKDGEKISSHY